MTSYFRSKSKKRMIINWKKKIHKQLLKSNKNNIYSISQKKKCSSILKNYYGKCILERKNKVYFGVFKILKFCSVFFNFFIISVFNQNH